MSSALVTYDPPLEGKVTRYVDKSGRDQYKTSFSIGSHDTTNQFRLRDDHLQKLFPSDYGTTNGKSAKRHGYSDVKDIKCSQADKHTWFITGLQMRCTAARLPNPGDAVGPMDNGLDDAYSHPRYHFLRGNLRGNQYVKVGNDPYPHSRY